MAERKSSSGLPDVSYTGNQNGSNVTKKVLKKAIGYGLIHLLLCCIVIADFYWDNDSRFVPFMLILIALGPSLNSIDIWWALRNTRKVDDD